jgi:acetyltransferase-like isoleucine patch superfamily enzyme
VVLFEGVTIQNSNIGDHTYVQKNAMINNADVGAFCSIAGGVCLGLPQHDICSVSSHPAFYLKDTPLAKTYSSKNYFWPSTRTKIGSDVWIGQNALIMSGVNIGVGAVIGAGAVVTRDVENYEVVAGVPAKHIRYRFGEEKRNALIKTKWWEMSDKWYEDNAALFLDTDKLIHEFSRRP